MITLVRTKRTDAQLLERMRIHYSKPKGFVGRNICYAVYAGDDYYGHIVGGSATRNLPGRHEFLGTHAGNLNNIINNIFFNVSRVQGKYPTRNFTSKCVDLFVETIQKDWEDKYGDRVVGFETLVELPREGRLYKKAGWTVVGVTKGYTCKRGPGVGTDSWTGARVWDIKNLKPKIVLCNKVKE